MGLFGRRSKREPTDATAPAAQDASPPPTPRCQHSTFAHHAFRQVAFRDRAKLLHALGLLEGPRMVRELWDAVGLQCAARGMPPDPEGDRPKVHPRLVADCRAVLLEMPVPIAPTEAHLVAAVLLPGAAGPDDEDARLLYYTLEVAPGADGGTVIGEWNERGGHRLLRAGPEPELEAFAAALVDLIGAERPGPE